MAAVRNGLVLMTHAMDGCDFKGLLEISALQPTARAETVILPS